MATLTITIPDNWVLRLRAAHGHGGVNPSDPWVNATVAEIEAYYLNQIRSKVKEYEGRKAGLAAQSTAEAAVDF